jgi:hypothetical protein
MLAEIARENTEDTARRPCEFNTKRDLKTEAPRGVKKVGTENADAR